MALHLDGTSPTGELVGEDAFVRAPYAIFDDVAQDWIITGIRFYWLAKLLLWYKILRS